MQLHTKHIIVTNGENPLLLNKCVYWKLEIHKHTSNAKGIKENKFTTVFYDQLFGRIQTII